MGVRSARTDVCVRWAREGELPRSVDPSHQPLHDTARLRELCSPLPSWHHLYAVSILTSLSYCLLWVVYTLNFTVIYSRYTHWALGKVGRPHTSYRFFFKKKNIEICWYILVCGKKGDGKGRERREKSMTRMRKKSDNNLLSLLLSTSSSSSPMSWVLC